MNTLRFDRIGETVFSAKLATAFRFLSFRKRIFRKSYAFFATKYGSIDTKFQLDGVCKDTPAGVAIS
jgi:hypothetical protein